MPVFPSRPLGTTPRLRTLAMPSWFIAVILLLHVGMLAWSARAHSPVFNEVGHLVGGLSHLLLGSFDLDRVNPPLVRAVGAAPVVLVSPSISFRGYDRNPWVRPEYAVGLDFARSNGSRSFWFVTIARWACIPFCVLGGYFCYRWACRLYGGASGLFALVLWCFSPQILGYGPLLVADAPSAAMGLIASYAFWVWLKNPNPKQTVVAGLVLGIAELTKYTLVILYPLMIGIWIVCRPPRPSRTWLRELSLLMGLVGLSILIINLGYLFEGSLQRLADYRFQSQALTGSTSYKNSSGSANRFSGTWLGNIPVPLPRNYVQGVDTQKTDFERGRRCYLRGRWRTRGWWYFYGYAMLIKVPLGTWGLFLMACCFSIFARGYSAPWHDEIVVLLPAVAIVTFVSMQTGFTIHSRYVLPFLPFLYVWVSKMARSVTLAKPIVAFPCVAGLIWSAAASVWVYPHNISYYNELVGGPFNGHAYLVDSNTAWGQDLLYLRNWVQENPRAHPVHLASFVYVDPAMLNTDFTVPPMGLASPDCSTLKPHTELGPRPGWYAIDVNYLQGTRNPMPDGQYGWVCALSADYDLTYFQRFSPVAYAGYSMHIYHITMEDANRVRRELGLTTLPEK